MKKFSGMSVSELGKWRQLAQENTRLKKPFADQSLDKHIVREIMSKCYEAHRQA